MASLQFELHVLLARHRDHPLHPILAAALATFEAEDTASTTPCSGSADAAFSAPPAAEDTASTAELRVFFSEQDLDPTAGHSGVFNNKPEVRKRQILAHLESGGDGDVAGAAASATTVTTVMRPVCEPCSMEAFVALPAHSSRFLEFLCTVHTRWSALNDAGLADEGNILEHLERQDGDASGSALGSGIVPGHSAPSFPDSRPGRSVAGQLAFYCQDRFTPIFSHTAATLRHDAAVVQACVRDLSERSRVWRRTLSRTGRGGTGGERVGTTQGENEPPAATGSEEDSPASTAQLHLLQGAAAAPLAAPPIGYAMVTCPGHHAGRESVGGYCFVNNACVACYELLAANSSEGDEAAERSERNKENGAEVTAVTAATAADDDLLFPKIALVDVDYHAGNGSLSILHDDPRVLCASIHLDPELEYPYNTGYADQRGGRGAAAGTNLCVPLDARTGWRSVEERGGEEGAGGTGAGGTGGGGSGGNGGGSSAMDEARPSSYEAALRRVLDAVSAFGASAIVVSLGVDTIRGDPECEAMGGMCLDGPDFVEMGRMFRASGLPLLFVQEGGYKLREEKDPRAEGAKEGEDVGSKAVGKAVGKAGGADGGVAETYVPDAVAAVLQGRYP